MLYPTLSDLTKRVGNRYLLVNKVAHRARIISEQAKANKEPLTEKAVKLAVMEIAEGLPMNAEEVEKALAEQEKQNKANG